jgi:hypothetical protein
MSAAISAILIGEPGDLDASVVDALLREIADRPATVCFPPAETVRAVADVSTFDATR